ncbi:MAG: DUF3078 domain-containing protein [Vicingaceae bacterium]
MKKLFLVLSLFLGLGTFAQVTDAEDDLLKKETDTLPDGWRLGGVFGANFSQVSLSNWSAGGQSSISINSLLNVFAKYKKDKTTWDNYLDLGYGVVKQGDSDMIKSDDRIEFTSKYGRRAAKNLYYAGLFNFRSQFAPGYNYPNDSVKISNFMAPGYFIGAVGMDYKPNDNFTLFLAPLTGKVTVVSVQDLADQGAFGVKAAEYDTSGNKISDGKTVRTEFGGYLRFAYVKEIAENITFQTNLNLFSNYLETPQNIDVNWDNLLSMKVNKYITANVSTSLIYDDDIDIQESNADGSPKLDSEGTPIVGPRTQFKYVIAVGFQYKFGDKQN